LALGGGGALGLTEIGALRWLEEHHIPVDLIAGTSMGCMVSSLYSSGKTPEELLHVMNDQVFSSVFSFSNPYTSKSFRRREDSRELPNALTIGLRHGVSLRNALLTDQGLNEFLNREFLRYDDQTDFNQMPIPLRCVATDLTDAQAATFARGSLPDAVRASVSIPGVFAPFELNGHAFVDGGVVENLPTPTVKAMGADVVLAFSLPIAPIAKGQLDSLLGVVGRSASVAINVSELQLRRQADVVMVPDTTGLGINDYLKAEEMAKRGYAAAEAQKAKLLQYAVSDEQWSAYLAHRAALVPGAPGAVLRVSAEAPNRSATRAVEALAKPLVGHSVDTHAIDSLLDAVRADGRYDAGYSVGYGAAKGAAATAEGVATAGGVERRPIVLLRVQDKPTGPPFLLAGVNLQAQTAGITKATVEGILLNQDLGGYGAELRSHVRLGYLTDLNSEYYRPLFENPQVTVFGAPRGQFVREPFPIFDNSTGSGTRLATRELQTFSTGADIGITNTHTQELRAGFDFAHVDWTTQIGADTTPDLHGTSSRGRIQYSFDNADRALVPQYGLHLVTEFAYLFNTVASPNAPEFGGQAVYSRQFRLLPGRPAAHGGELFAISTEGGTMFGRKVAQPFRYTLGGPLRLSASTIDQYRGTEYFLIEPALLRRIAQLPQPLGQSIYVGGSYEFGRVFAPGVPTITRQDVFFGVVAETPLGVITLGPALGTNQERKFVFTIGKLF
jgi:NTE family protein